MTKKDYELIANAINEVMKSEMAKCYTTSITHLQMIIVEPFAEKLENENPKFNRKKFIDACLWGLK